MKIETHVKTGDILLFPARDWVGRIIQWATNSKWSHCAVVVHGRLELVVEAQAGLVRSIPLANLDRGYSVYRVHDKYPYDKDMVVEYLLKALNSKYDMAGVLYLGLLKVLAKIGFNTKNAANKWQKDRDYFCSELCYLAFLAGGIDIVPNVGHADIVSPGDIAESTRVYLVE